jgi:pimeloyl-ACP methyl ester carboxylesterase
MPTAAVHGIEIAYETTGKKDGRPLLLIGGLADQLVFWGDDFIEDLVRRGHFVIRYDNRDIGLSTKCDNMRKAHPPGKKGPAYALDDLADDAVGLLDALGIAKAHICGTSMGGMIGQTIAIRHPGRVLSLISIYSSTGNKELPGAKPEIAALLFAPAPMEREPYIEHMVKVFRAMSGSGFAFDEAWTREAVAKGFDRGVSPAGIARQVNAVMHQPDRRAALAAVTVPTLIIHGTDDPVAPLEQGRDTANAIRGARLLVIEGMGHDHAHGGAWVQIAGAIAEHTLGAAS